MNSILSGNEFQRELVRQLRKLDLPMLYGTRTLDKYKGAVPCKDFHVRIFELNSGMNR